MKKFIYHEVPQEMRGSLLYPLHILKNVYFDIYEKEISKYKGSEHLIKCPIPPLNCTWADVVFTAMVHPEIVKAASHKEGLVFPQRSYFKINIGKLDHTLMAVYTASLFVEPTVHNFNLFDPSKVKEYATIPKEFNVYCHYVKNRIYKTFMPYCLVPHILYKGIIDITNVHIITI